MNITFQFYMGNSSVVIFHFFTVRNLVDEHVVRNSGQTAVLNVLRATFDALVEVVYFILSDR
ncbi:GSCOCG00013100001-RA-CDS [Cotesia congregata]|nr:GSCOCG00013100001-RA-CDS [Cotesia congregata]